MKVLGDHGVLHGAHLYSDSAAVDADDGDVLLHGGVRGAGDDLGHFLPAAHNGHAGVVKESDNVAAVFTDMKIS